MRSGNPIDPGVTISRTPSGRIAVSPPPGLLVVATRGRRRLSRPYAPPEFTIIGRPSTRHMGSR